MTEKSSSSAFHGIIHRGQPGSGMALTRPRSFTSGAKRPVGATSLHFLKHILRHKRTAEKRKDTYRSSLTNPVYRRLYTQISKRYEPILPAAQPAPKADKSTWQPMDYVLSGNETSASPRPAQMTSPSSTVQSFSSGMAIPRMEDDPTARPKAFEKSAEKAPEKRPQKPVVPPTHRLFSRVTEVTAKGKEPSPTAEPGLDVPEPPRPAVTSTPKREAPQPAAHPMASHAHESADSPAFEPPSGPPASAKPVDIPIHQARRVHPPAPQTPAEPDQVKSQMPDHVKPEASTQPHSAAHSEPPAKPVTPAQEVVKPASPSVQPGTVQRAMEPLAKPLVARAPQEQIPAALPAKPKVNRPSAAPAAKPAHLSTAPVIQAKHDDHPEPSAPQTIKPETGQASAPAPAAASEKGPALSSAPEPVLPSEKPVVQRMAAHPVTSQLATHDQPAAPAEPSTKPALPLVQPHREASEPAAKPAADIQQVNRPVKTPPAVARPEAQPKPLVRAIRPAQRPTPAAKPSLKPVTAKPVTSQPAPTQPGPVEQLAPRPALQAPEIPAKSAPALTPEPPPAASPALKLTLRSRPHHMGVTKSNAVRQAQPGANISHQAQTIQPAAAPASTSKLPDASEKAPLPTPYRRPIRTFTNALRNKTAQAPQPKSELPIRTADGKSEPVALPAVHARPTAGVVRIPVIQRMADTARPSRLPVRTRANAKTAQPETSLPHTDVEKPVRQGMQASAPAASTPSVRLAPFAAPSERTNAPAKMTLVKQKPTRVSAAPQPKSKPAPTAPKKKEAVRPPQTVQTVSPEPAREKIAMPVVNPSQPGVIQRMPAEAPAQPPVQAEEPQEIAGKSKPEEGKTPLNLDELARQVYPILLRKISIERERSSRWH